MSRIASLFHIVETGVDKSENAWKCAAFGAPIGALRGVGNAAIVAAFPNPEERLNEWLSVRPS